MRTIPFQKRVNDFMQGDKVTYSEVGKQQLNPRNTERIGYISTPSNWERRELIRVRWEGRKGVDSLHFKFLRLYDEKEE